MSLTAHPYAGEADLPPIVELLNACEARDHLNEGSSVEELRVEFADPIFDVARNARLWRDAHGRLLGYSHLWVSEPGETLDGRLTLKVHPEARGSDLETPMIAWAEARLREAGQPHRLPITLHGRVRDDQTEQIALLEARGFVIDRYYFTMSRSLEEPVPVAVMPPGFTIRQVVGLSDGEQWVAMFNESFVDHWNFHPLTVEHFNQGFLELNYQADLDLIALAPDGTFAAFCYGYINPAENKRNGRRDGWIGVLGTRRGFRKLGLGRAMLLTGMARLRAAGAETARLGVDAASPTGATRLYESVGFRPIEARISLVKPLS